MSHLRVQTELPPSGILRIELFLFCSPVLCPGDKGRNQLWSRPMLLWEQCLLLLGGLSQPSFPRAVFADPEGGQAQAGGGPRRKSHRLRFPGVPGWSSETCVD